MFFERKENRTEISKEDFESIFDILTSPHQGEDFEEAHKDTLRKFLAKVRALNLDENIYFEEQEVRIKKRFNFQSDSVSQKTAIIIKNLRLTEETAITLHSANEWDPIYSDWTRYVPNRFVFQNNWFEKQSSISTKSAVEFIGNEGHYISIQANIDARTPGISAPPKIVLTSNKFEQLSITDRFYDQISHDEYYRGESPRRKVILIDFSSNNFEKLTISFNHLETGEITFLDGNNIGSLQISDSEKFQDGTPKIKYGDSIKFGLKEHIDPGLIYHIENKKLFMHLLERAEVDRDKLQETAINRILRHLDRGFALRAGNHSLLWLNDFFESGTSFWKPLCCILALGLFVTGVFTIASVASGNPLSFIDFIYMFSLSLNPLSDLTEIVSPDCKLALSGLNTVSMIHKGLYAYFLYYFLKAIYRYNI